MSADMAAFIGDGGQLVVAVSLGRGVEGEGERKVGRAGGEVKVIARLQVGQVLIELLGAGRLEDEWR